MKHIQAAITKLAGAVVLVMVLAALLRPLLPCLFAVVVLAFVFQYLRRNSE